MPSQMEIEPITKQLEVRQPTALALMMAGIESGKLTAGDLQILQEMHFKQMARDAETEFNLAMNAVQSELGRISTDLNNPQTHSRYASYAALDRAIRPIYTRHGFSLSFDSGESPADTVIAYCFVSHRGGHTRKYQSPAMPLPVMGPQGKAVMTTTHGTGAAMSYAMRYLLKFIFNIAVGEDDTDGNVTQGHADYDELQDRLKYFESCQNLAELEEHWRNSYRWAREQKDQNAIDAINTCKNTRKAQLSKGAK